MKRERNEKATHNFLSVRQYVKKTTATIVLPLMVLLFAQLIATAQTNAAFQFLDEDSQEGATLGALSTPRPWLTTAVSDWMSKLPDMSRLPTFPYRAPTILGHSRFRLRAGQERRTGRFEASWMQVCDFWISAHTLLAIHLKSTTATSIWM